MGWPHPVGAPLHPISLDPRQPWALTACSISASWAQSRMMSRLAEKSLRVEKRYLGGRQS